MVSEVLGAAWIQLEATYIGRRKGKVNQWVEMRPIFEVCARDQGYEGGYMEIYLVVTGGTKQNDKVNLGGYLAGDADKEAHE